MALTDITFAEGFSELANRGNIGVLVDIDFTPKLASYLFLVVPVVGDVKSGVVYGQQGTEKTGTYVASGGSTYARNRVVNA